MATYNFTIRATDNAGAYADQSFSLTVNNTIFDRFVMVHSNGLHRSPDGVNWTYEANLTGTGVNYGGGKWVVWTNSGALLRSSPDGTSWSSYTPTFTSLTGSITGCSHMKYRNGTWTGMFSNTNGNIEEWTSADAVTWTKVAAFAMGGSSVQYNAGDFDWDAAGNIIVPVTQNSTSPLLITRAAAGSTYTSIAPATGVPAMTSYTTAGAGTVRNYNGLWIYMPIGGTYCTTSVDGTNWVPRALPGGLAGMLYLNGRILSQPWIIASATTRLYESTNAGRSFAVRNGGTNFTMPYSANAPQRQLMCYFGGQLLVTAYTANVSAYFRSLDDGLTWTGYTPANVGNVYAIAARDGIN